MDSEERLAVIEKQQRLARGEDPSQRIIDVARVVQFADVCLSPDGMSCLWWEVFSRFSGVDDHRLAGKSQLFVCGKFILFSFTYRVGSIFETGEN